MTEPANSSACNGFQEELSDVAFGLVTGRRRAQILQHVEHCLRCSGELEDHMMVTNSLLELALDVEPPLGFEMRLGQRLRAGATTPPRHRWRRSLSLVASAALLAGILGFGVGLLETRTNGANAQASATASAPLHSGARVMGEVFVVPGTRSWMYMTVKAGSWSGVVQCELVLTNGKILHVGHFELYPGYDSWGAPFRPGGGKVRQAKLVGNNGTVLASASFG